MASSPTSTAPHDRKLDPAASPAARWRTRREQESYSSKLLDALRLVRAASGRPSPASSREVRHAADRALAVAARGRSRWSRAILASRARACALRRVRLGAPPPPPAARPAPRSRPPLASKAKVLGRLVPGCRKLAFPALLAEASDYIAALEMQVRAMAALAQALQSVAPAPPPPSSSS
ncbi:transcription factor bHLH149-like [Oryza glaberrima]|uniref:transcription factor bHLH149-like n=1 Tax=Oryza glaberrima TaxID=4538 RepID=UPI00224C071C|nr:transcription factor bHLH149-like [Oryza glaberrima]